MSPSLRDQYLGCLLGTAVGDSMGLPLEGMSRRRGKRMARGPFRHRLVFGRGMISDDTDHLCMTAQSLLSAPSDPDAFARSLAWRLRGWLFTLPAGIGFGTLRSLIKLWLGFSPQKSGVFSAGNGPAMRAPIFGLWPFESGELRDRFVQASTSLTHTDPKAFEGSKAITEYVHHFSQNPDLNPKDFLQGLAQSVQGEEFRERLTDLQRALEEGISAETFADQLGLEKGITGYINHTVPIVLFCLLKFGANFEEGLREIVALGGDADTTGAIYGGAAGAVYGVNAIPKAWRDGIFEWPRSVSWMSKLGEALAAAHEGQSCAPVPLFWPAYGLRSPFYIAVIFAHIFRRMAPPY